MRVRLQLVVDPRLEVGWFERHRLLAHAGVAEAAELGALTGVDARVVGLHAQRVQMRPGTASRLPLSRGIQYEWMTSRLVMRSSTGVSVGITSSPLVTMGWVISTPPHCCTWVVVLPPPLLTGDVDDALGVVGLGQREHRDDGGHGDADQDDRRKDGERDLERRVAVRLLGDVLTAVLELG